MRSFTEACCNRIDRTGNPELGDAAETARLEAEAGKLLLFQKRHGFRDYEYRAVKASPAILKLIELCAASAKAAVS